MFDIICVTCGTIIVVVLVVSTPVNCLNCHGGVGFAFDESASKIS